jgi:hypothetical protein
MILYSIIDENNYITHCEWHEECPANGTPLLNSQFIKPRLENGILIEGATPEEINKKTIPATISQMNLRVQLVLKSIPIASIYQTIEAIPNEIQKQLIYNKFEYAAEFDRTDQSLNQLAMMLNVSQENLDQMFIDGNLV